MPLKPLDNLVKTGQLKEESPTKDEFEGLVRSARIKLKDSTIPSLSLESRFELIYSAAHSLSLATLRSQGYRSENRITVFQSLVHTTGLSSAKMRVLSNAHNKRNLSAYEGELDLSESLVTSLSDVTNEILKFCEKIKIP